MILNLFLSEAEHARVDVYCRTGSSALDERFEGPDEE